MINKEYIEKFINNTLVYPDDEGMQLIRKQAADLDQPILRKSVACLLDIIIRTAHPNKILEIGTSIGYSTLVMLNAMNNNGSIITVEIDEQIAKMARENFKNKGVDDRIRLLIGDAGEILYYMEGQFDLIFLDGPKAQYINYLPYCLKLLRNGGLLICDDVLFYGMVANNKIINKRKITIVKRMKDFLKLISTHPNLRTSIIPIGDGLSISYKEEE